MPPKSRLKAVTDETPPPPSRGVKAAAESGDRRELLVAMRDRIAVAVENPRTPPRDLAALTRRLLEIAKDLEAMDAEDADDDISAAAATPDEEWVTG